MSFIKYIDCFYRDLMSNMDYSKYIFPLDSTTDGSGVLVGNLFITAGHVIEMSTKPAVVIEGRSYPLDKMDALVFDTNPDKRTDGYDVAIYRLPNLISPLLLSETTPSEGEELLSCSFKHNVSGTPGLSSNIFSSGIKEEWLFENHLGKVISHYDNYFECQFEETLSKGSSGSPILKGEEVAGILYGDKDGKNSSKTVLFLSSAVILRLLNEANNNK